MRVLSLFVSVWTLVPLLENGQTRPDDDLRPRMQRLEDQAALKNLVDTFSNLADVKDIDRQVLLFTEDATVESRTGDAPRNPLKGRKQIGDTFRSFLAGFETVYHINGQQTTPSAIATTRTPSRGDIAVQARPRPPVCGGPATPRMRTTTFS